MYTIPKIATPERLFEILRPTYQTITHQELARRRILGKQQSTTTTTLPKVQAPTIPEEQYPTTDNIDTATQDLLKAMTSQMSDMRSQFAQQIAELTKPKNVSTTVMRSGDATQQTGKTLGERDTTRESISRDFTSSRWKISRKDPVTSTMGNTGITIGVNKGRDVFAGLKV